MENLIGGINFIHKVNFSNQIYRGLTLSLYDFGLVQPMRADALYAYAIWSLEPGASLELFYSGGVRVSMCRQRPFIFSFTNFAKRLTP